MIHTDGARIAARVSLRHQVASRLRAGCSAILVVGAIVVTVLLPASVRAQLAPSPVAYTAQQAAAGGVLYADACASCHGSWDRKATLGGKLEGEDFQRRWAGQSAASLIEVVERMPPGASKQISDADRVSLLAYLLQTNGIAPSETALPEARDALADLSLPLWWSRGLPVSGRAVNIPPVLRDLRPVSSADLVKPPAEDWLIWRRSYDAWGWSPLKQINRKNARALKVAWAWSLPPGGNMMTPMVRDGVLYALSFNDVLEALDARTGDLLWRHQHRISESVIPQGKKGVALAEDLVLMPTSDMHVLAINAKSGAVVWDHQIETHGEKNHQIKSAPLVADGKVIIGVNGFNDVKGGNFVVAIDLKTGREAWRFYTVARPDGVGGNTWNGLPLERRNGGSVWVSATYDPGRNVVYFGAAPTYDGALLRKPSGLANVSSDALFTNSTVALDAATGKLLWYFQHQPNDQLDHDWAFERTLLNLKVNGQSRAVLVTGGKGAIFEALDRATGQYLYSMDLGLQNVITHIDPKTGAKTLNPAAVPAPDQILVGESLPGACPNAIGARNHMSTSFSPERQLLFVPLNDTCITPFPDGQRWQKEPQSTGQPAYGQLQALDLQNRSVKWTTKTAAGPVSGSLSTAGGLVFLGFADRTFRAFDDRNGKELWSVKLDNAPASYPVTFSVGGRQYVAVATNEGFVQVEAMRLASNIAAPPGRGATLWVFALDPE